MLLEYFFNSGPSESLSDAKPSIKSADQKGGMFLASGTDEFKLALNSSIQSRSIYLNNQVDTKHNESDLLYNVKALDELYTGEPSVSMESNVDMTEDEIAKFIQNVVPSVSGISENDVKLSAGDEMPTNGNSLPVNTPIAQRELVTENLKPTIQESKSSENVVVSVTDNKTETKQSIKRVVDNQSKIQNGYKGVNNTDQKNNPLKVENILTNDQSKVENTKNSNLNPTLDKLSESISVKAHYEKSSESNKLLQKTVLKNSENVNTESNITNTKTTGAKTQNATSIALTNAIKENNANQQVEAVNKESVGNKSVSGLLSEKIKITNKTTAEVLASNEQKLNLINDSNKSNSILPKSDSEQSLQFNKTIVPDSLKPELSKQAEIQKNNLDPKNNSLVEQAIPQIKRDEVIPRQANHSVLETVNQTNVRTTTVVTEAVANQTQTQQVTTNQTFVKAAEVALPVSVPTPQWNQKFAEHVSMLALKGTTNAQIKLDPPELGPMAIRIQHTGTETQVQFQVNNPIAKDLVESAMQRLKESLEEHGFENVDVDVAERQQQDQLASGDMMTEQDFEGKIDEINANSGTVAETIKNNALVDLFA